MEVPVVDLSKYLGSTGDRELQEEVGEQCREVSRILSETGALVVKDPRCSAQDNDRFIDMMEKYFECSDEFKRGQERPHLHYQVIHNINTLRERERERES
ncbi:hypothetical protein MLD38_003596 [Melastoma candidum]|uniref:Uncharacterized protein n=1 Tax=Melastoma candidum TaxID=119954 RepID=A0ACB9S382_9MYRT|nr:hypothetical protein MLD38_003596 [Melastoma candidum]